jgi:hypothetical protein
LRLGGKYAGYLKTSDHEGLFSDAGEGVDGERPDEQQSDDASDMSGKDEHAENEASSDEDASTDLTEVI